MWTVLPLCYMVTKLERMKLNICFSIELWRTMYFFYAGKNSTISFTPKWCGSCVRCENCTQRKDVFVNNGLRERPAWPTDYNAETSYNVKVLFENVRDREQSPLPTKWRLRKVCMQRKIRLCVYAFYTEKTLT